MAMAKVTMRLEGFESLQRALAKAPEVVRAHAAQAVAASTFAVAQGARALVPVATGTLRNAIDSSRGGNGLTGRIGITDRAAFYWRFVEFGTKHMAARPFFRPAAEAESDTYVARMRAIGPMIERDLSVGRNL